MSPSQDNPEASLPRLKERPAESHKGDYGRILLIGGSRGMVGAVALSGKAALRSGAGLVTLAVPEPCLDLAAAFEPCYMTAALPADREGRISAPARTCLERLMKSASVIGCGPGLGRSKEITELVGWLYRTVRQPLVLDADALNSLAECPEAVCQAGGSFQVPGPRVLTPHPGEFDRLIQAMELQGENATVQADQLARQSQAVVVLKGHRTLVTDGCRSSRNPSGNPGMATGGSGDVLLGVIAALLGQEMACYDAARLGVYLHGRAGDLAAQEQGQISMVASDLIGFLSSAFKEHHGGRED
ncbi:MAG: NAD(P)H-hydrate dehydratase [Planctomycetaceae bacterium]|nr:NAD(P)H-hydrate dehydratase [Planctomycetaceae bacterium]MBP63407.1 NAD(P)H-hydrate dehydratase [Planctomycetaceae bacterium]